jgi:hypothetical protein
MRRITNSTQDEVFYKPIIVQSSRYPILKTIHDTKGTFTLRSTGTKILVCLQTYSGYVFLEETLRMRDAMLWVSSKKVELQIGRLK